MSERRISRRGLLGAAATVPAAAGLHALVSGGGFGGEAALADAHGSGGAAGHGGHGGFAHATFAPGRSVDHRANGFDPSELLRDFDYGKTRRLASGGVLREWEIVAQDKEIEVAPGVRYEAWTYNGRVPGPTLRAREGDRLRIRLVNASEHPHTMHFHGIHPAQMDGMPGIGEARGGGQIDPGEAFAYEFDAEPFGLHLYHCHVAPLAAHISRGLYGAFVIDPKRGRPDADEMVMVMSGFDTNFDLSNEIYAVNAIGFHYANEPIQVQRDELVRIYLVNALEFDPINSFHVHANFFQHYPTGTSLEPSELTDTVVQGQGQRGILEMKFPFDGDYMFHAHVSEFAELGWTGFFRVGNPSGMTAAAAAAYCKLPWGGNGGVA
ncbi:MAG TPA: multicopper oxidase domain-containing protein [Solirubrobacterales bacterium]|jgi:FtsP/CotA-like multicopper oxidase with cupredoxin domain|nr:multicopper oxidase domain-containing protein [Solirubrobacterales bacterium]